MSSQLPRLAALCGAEWRKLRGRGLGAAVLLFGALHGIAALAALKGLEVLSASSGQSGDAADFLIAGEVAVRMATSPFNGLVLLLAAAVLWAEDFSRGTLAMLLVRPVSRSRIFLAKALVAACVPLASLGLALLLGSLGGLLLFGTESDLSLVGQSPWVHWMAEVPSVPQRGFRVLLGLGTSLLSLGPAFALVALLAVLTRSPIGTLFGTAFLLGSELLTHLILTGIAQTKLDLAPLADTLRHLTLTAARSVTDHHGPGTLFSDGLTPLGLSLGYTALFTALALALFRRADVH